MLSLLLLFDSLRLSQPLSLVFCSILRKRSPPPTGRKDLLDISNRLGGLKVSLKMLTGSVTTFAEAEEEGGISLSLTTWKVC